MFRHGAVQCTLGVVVMLSSGAGMAAGCNYDYPLDTSVHTMPLRATQITVGRDIPLGTELFRQVFHSNDTTLVRCAPGTTELTLRRRVTLVTTPTLDFQHPGGGSIYPTDIAGIGVRFLDRHSQSLPYTLTLDNCPGPTVCILNPRELEQLTVSFVKTSHNVRAGVLSGMSLPTIEGLYKYRAGNRYEGIFRRVGFSGNIIVVSQTCKTPSLNINLGTHIQGELEREGFTPWQNFDIVLSQCPGFHGYYSAGAALNGSGSQFNTNKITVRIDPAGLAMSSEEGILNLSPLKPGGVISAQGIGVQIANEHSQPIRLSTLFDSGISPQITEGANYSIRLKARYIKQAGAQMRGGPANAFATFILNYQ